LRRAHGRFVDAGATLAVVGQGTPEQTVEFVDKLELPYPVLADPKRTAYAAYGLAAGGAKAFLNPASARAVLRSIVSGAGGGRPVGDPRELGGAFVVDRDGRIRLAHPARYAGDTPTVDELLAAVAAVPHG
jgi:peroxiredoxin